MAQKDVNHMFDPAGGAFVIYTWCHVPRPVSFARTDYVVIIFWSAGLVTKIYV